MVDKLRKLNPYISIYSIHDEEFEKYGRVYDVDASEIVKECKSINLPETGSSYQLSVEKLENLKSSCLFKEMAFGGCETQIGICMGYNTTMNALEFHKSSEINIAVTPLVILLGLEYELDKNMYDSSKIKAFYLDSGDVIEIFGTTMHFCPCQVKSTGFSNVVILPKDTNAPLDNISCDKLLFKKNKWLICHERNKELIEKGVFPGIHGENYEVKY
jgi:hypothetical protein